MHENKKSNFHINGFALSLALKQRLGQFINGLLIEKITKRSNNTEKTSAKAECKRLQKSRHPDYTGIYKDKCSHV